MTFADLQQLELSSGSHAELMPHWPLIHTNSSIGMFSSCEQRWFLRYVLGLIKRRVASPLVTGTLVHLGLETAAKMMRGDGHDPLTGAFVPPTIPQIVANLDTMFELAVDKISEKSDMVSANDVEKLEYCRVQSLAMVEAWCENNLHRYLKWKIIGIENLIDFRSMAKSDHLYHNHPDTFWGQMGGKVDYIVENENGDLFIQEHKTRSRMDTFDSRHLAIDQQSNFYLAAMEIILQRPIRGVLYNVILKPQHRMNAKGSSDLKKRMVDAMMADPEKYFCFTDVIADRHDVQNNIDNMVRWVKRMNDSHQSSITRNTGACDQYGGCAYRPLCQNGAIAESLPSIAKNPYIDQFDFAPINTELAEEEETDD